MSDMPNRLETLELDQLADRLTQNDEESVLDDDVTNVCASLFLQTVRKTVYQK